MVHFSWLEAEERGPENEETPANEVNFAYRFINLANSLWQWIGKERNWPWNVLALATPDSTEGDCVAFVG